DAKEALHGAATLAGLAASNAQRGVAHALARALVGPTGLPYAHLLGIVLPYALDFDHPAARVRKFYENIRLPTDLKAAGILPEQLDAHRGSIVANALRLPGVLANPRVPS